MEVGALWGVPQLLTPSLLPLQKKKYMGGGSFSANMSAAIPFLWNQQPQLKHIMVSMLYLHYSFVEVHGTTEIFPNHIMVPKLGSGF